MTDLTKARSLSLRLWNATGLLYEEAADMIDSLVLEVEQLSRWKSTNAPRIESLEGLLEHERSEAAAGKEALVEIRKVIEELASEREANAILTAEVERLKTVPMKYRRMAFNAELQKEIDTLRTQLAEAQAEAERLSKGWADANLLEFKHAQEIERLTKVDVEPVAKFNWNTGRFEWLTEYSYALHHDKPLVLASALAALRAQLAREIENSEGLERTARAAELMCKDLMEQLAEAQASPMSEEVIDILRSERDAAQAENKRLREALEKIATFDYKLRPTPEDLRDVARAALKGDV